MRACSSCSTDYDETFKFCPECGHKFGAAASGETARMNAELDKLVASARVEGRREIQMKNGGVQTTGAFSDGTMAATNRVLGDLGMSNE